MSWSIHHGDFTETEFLKGQVHLITGATRGIGQALCWELARAGATVLMLARDEKALEKQYDEMLAEGLPEPVIIPLDLETLTLDAAEELAGMIEQNFGRLSSLVNNAGLLGTRAPVSLISEKEHQRVMRVNVDSNLLLTQGMLPLLQNAPQSTLIYTSSGVGVKARAFWGSYAISKFAIEALAQLVHEENENLSDMRVFCVDPGATRTQMRASAYPGEDRENNPPPEALMPFYRFLLSPSSQSERGQRLKARLDR